MLTACKTQSEETLRGWSILKEDVPSVLLARIGNQLYRRLVAYQLLTELELEDSGNVLIHKDSKKLDLYVRGKNTDDIVKLSQLDSSSNNDK